MWLSCSPPTVPPGATAAIRQRTTSTPPIAEDDGNRPVAVPVMGRIAAGTPIEALEGATMLERRAHFLRDFDWIRTGLMFEPRGHDMMSGSILYPPTRPDCDVAVLFIETSGCLPMCGHGTIGTITMGIENGLIQPREPGRLSIDAPAGRVDVTYRQEGRFVEEVRLTNVPGFLHAEGLTAEVEAAVSECPGVRSCVVVGLPDPELGQRVHAIIEGEPEAEAGDDD